MFASAWGGNEFTPLLVMYREGGSLSGIAVDGLLFAYVLGIIPALLIGGPLSDRLGRRALMLPAPVFAAVGSALIAAGPHSLALLGVGRVFSGVALGLSMAVGGTWLTEITRTEGRPAAVGARRAAMSLTAGFGIGAGLAGALAQWGPWPHVLPYLVNIGIAVVAVAWVVRTPETRQRAEQPGRLIDDLKIRGLTHRRFLLVVLPLAPWVFGACGVGYAVIPALFTEATSAAPIAFAALCCVVGLTAGLGIQIAGRRIDRPDGVRGVAVAFGLLAVGMALAAGAAASGAIWLALVASTMLGGGYGMAMIAGLLEVQRLAPPSRLAGMTAVFYSCTYLGFAMPMILAWIAEQWSVGYPAMFGFGVAAALAGLILVAAVHRMLRRPTRT
nr:MFS transporter [Gordonia soli]